VLAGLYWERTRDRDTLQAIWPNIKAGLEWIERYGDRDGDSFVEYDRKRDTGLRNQGWKDSKTPSCTPTAASPSPPSRSARCRATYTSRSTSRPPGGGLRRTGLVGRPVRQRGEAPRKNSRRILVRGARDLCARARRRQGAVPRAQLERRASSLTGIAEPDRAARVAQGLAARDFFTGWGIRTLSSREKRFNPTSYHTARSGRTTTLSSVSASRAMATPRKPSRSPPRCFEAAAQMHLRRLPELFCGFERKRDKAPTLYPVACAPQAWAACAPVAMLQACLGLEIDARTAGLNLRRPRLPRLHRLAPDPPPCKSATAASTSSSAARKPASRSASSPAKATPK